MFFSFIPPDFKRALRTRIISLKILLANRSAKRFFLSFAKRKQKISGASAVSQGKAAPPALIKKYEMGSGKNKINVRIFMEPTTEPTTTER